MKRTPWTAADLATLRQRYPDTLTAVLAEQLGRSLSAVYGMACLCGLKKSPAFFESAVSARLRADTGQATRFGKGHVPWNKGTTYVAGGRSAETRFKPGHLGGRALERQQPIGAERVSKDGYLQRKVNNDMPLQQRWRGVHLINWEVINGPLPAGHALVFRDGDRRNCDPANLELVTRQELMRRNSYHNYGHEIAQCVQLRGAITRQINKRSPK